MEKIKLEEKYILEYIRDTLISISSISKNYVSDRYHHNTNYNNLSSILEYGILNLVKQKNKGLLNISEERMKNLSDTTSHINGVDGISLAVMGLDDLSKKEIEYDAFNPVYADIIVSDSILAFRNATHYGNEFICNHSIKPDMIKCIDTRLFKYMERLNQDYLNYNINELVKAYNKIIEAASIISENNLDIFLRDMSDSVCHNIDIEKASDMPILRKTNKAS